MGGRPPRQLAVPSEAGFERRVSFHDIPIIMILAIGPAAIGGTLCHKGD
jgi:hypothetical protein